MGFRNPVRTLPADRITGQISGSQLAANAIDGKVITGATIQTDDTGRRIVLGPDGTILFYSGADAEDEPGAIETGVTAEEMSQGYLVIRPPKASSAGPPTIVMTDNSSGNRQINAGPLALVEESSGDFASVFGDLHVFGGDIDVDGRRVAVTQAWTTVTDVAWTSTPSVSAYQGLRIATDGQRVYLDGAASTLTAYSSGNQHAFTIPSGMRPLKSHYYAVPRATSGSPSVLGCLVQSTGVVLIYTSSAVATTDTFGFSRVSWPLD